MQFLANENFPLKSVFLLREYGYQVASVTEDSPGIKDQEVLQRAVQERRIMLTFDRDYGELIYRKRLPAPPGVVYFRFEPVSPEEPARRLLMFLTTGQFRWQGKFTIIERGRVRQKPLP